MVNSNLSKQTESLLPCPWCRGTDIRTFEGFGVEYAQCMDCTSCGPDHKNGRHWNDAPRTASRSPDVLRLMQFYDVSTLEDLALTQMRHVERLQERLPPTPDTQPRKSRFA